MSWPHSTPHPSICQVLTMLGGGIKVTGMSYDWTTSEPWEPAVPDEPYIAEPEPMACVACERRYLAHTTDDQDRCPVCLSDDVYSTRRKL